MPEQLPMMADQTVLYPDKLRVIFTPHRGKGMERRWKERGDEIRLTRQSTEGVVQAHLVLSRDGYVNPVETVGAMGLHHYCGVLGTRHYEVDIQITTLNHLSKCADSVNLTPRDHHSNPPPPPPPPPPPGFHLEKLVWGGRGKLWASKASAWKFFAQTTPTLANTPTFHILEVVHSMLTTAVFLIMHSVYHMVKNRKLILITVYFIIIYHRNIWGRSCSVWGGGGGELLPPQM